MFFQNWYVEALTSNVIVLRGVTFGMLLGIDEVLKVKPSMMGLVRALRKKEETKEKKTKASSCEEEQESHVKTEQEGGS